MALRGNLKDFSLPDVFQLVTFSRKTGVLRIEREDGALGSVWFRDGDVFFAQSNWHTEPLGERLVRAQRLTPQALDRALKLRAAEAEGGRRLGQILIEEGYLTDAVLEAFVSEQIQETIFDLMRWDEGDFDFEAMPEAVEEDIGLSVSIENVIMEGSRRLEEWTRIKKKIPSVDVVFKMATAPGEGTFEISLKPMEWNLLLLVDGTRSVAELAHETSRTDFEVARIIYGLFSAGLLEFATDEEVTRLRAERVAREEKLAVIEAECKAAEAAAQAQARATAEAAARAEAQAQAQERAAAEAAVEPAAETPVAEPVASTEPVEVPEFLGGMSAAPTADDAAVLQEMMGAVLQTPTPEAVDVVPEPTTVPEPPAPSAVPHVPAEDPAFMAVDHVDTGDLAMMPVPSVDELLTDLADLQSPSAAAADEAASAVVAAFEDVPEVVESQHVVSAEELSLADLGQSLAGLGEVATPVDDSVDLGYLLEPVAEPASLVPPIIVADEPEAEPVAEPVAEQPLITPMPTEDFERDLMSLGLGELPADLFADTTTVPELEVVVPELEATVPEPAEEPEPTYDWVETPPPAAPVAALPSEPGMPDFSELLESLDVEPEPVVIQSEELVIPVVIPVEVDFDEELLREVAPAETGGVISTDAFLDDINMGEMDFSGGLTDELSALTGADRPNRPTTNVNKIPEPGSGELLQRDTRVDKDTLLKIIDGIKNL